MLVVDFRTSCFPLNSVFRNFYAYRTKLCRAVSNFSSAIESKINSETTKKSQNMTTISMTYGFGSLYKYSIIIYTSSRIKETAISVPK
jgi:hypothetical protein